MDNSKVLALKYRPKNFDELVGQEAVAKTLKYSLESNSLANAYLFSGLRGSGKTSSARIFSKTLLCEKAPTSTPCEECESCKMANLGSHIDIIEMDAASNRKIDDIRDLIEQTQYQPSIGRFKIFIIDEVHMLTKEAFNALLKTLEEPPNYVKFVLATTDPLKLPQTILSRTQHFSFKRIDRGKIEEHLKYILIKEGIEYDLEAIETIARSGGGSLRDTLTTLQQAIVYSGNSLNISSVTEMLGLVDPQTLENILSLVINRDREELIKSLKSLESYDTEMIFDEFINFLKGKIFSNEVDALILQKIFEALNSGKKLLFTGADGEFVLYLTFLKMISDEIEKRVVQVQEVVKTASEKIPQRQIQSGNSDNDFFWNVIIPEVITANPPSPKITDEMLLNCINNHIEFISFKDGSISLQFCFKESEGCKKLLRARYTTIQTISILEFNKKSGGKSRFNYLECSDEQNKIEIKKEEIVEVKKEENIVVKEEEQPLSMENFVEHLKDRFGEENIKEKE